MNPPGDLARTTLAVLFIVGLSAASLWILRPFLLALIWAAMIVVATWPLMLRVQARLWQRRLPAVLVMTIALLLVFIIPFSLAIGTLAANADAISGWTQSLNAIKLPAPPDWVHTLPLAGERVASAWNDLAASGPEELGARIEPHARDLARWFVNQVGSFGLMTGHFLLTVVISAILYAKGETAAAGVSDFCRRLAGERGEAAVRLSAQAIRAVAIGVILTAIIVAALAAIGLWAASVPFAAILAAFVFVLAVAQIGPAPVLIGAVAWLYWKGDPVWATALLAWSLLIMAIDSLLRPYLIQKGADLPLLLIFSGVIGGLIAFGVVGIFTGPLVLAVSYRLLEAWVSEGRERNGR